MKMKVDAFMPSIDAAKTQTLLKDNSESSIKPDLQDRKQYKIGDRVKLRIKEKQEVWGTVIEHNSAHSLCLFLDEAIDIEQKKSFKTINHERQETLKKLGISNPERPNCFLWGDFSPNYIIGTDKVIVLDRLLDEETINPAGKSMDVLPDSIFFDCHSNRFSGCRHDSQHEPSTRKVYAALKIDKGNPDLVYVCDQHFQNRVSYNWENRSLGFEGLVPLDVGPAPSYKFGDRLQIKINNEIVWATVVDERGSGAHEPRLSYPLLHLDKPNPASHDFIPEDRVKPISDMGINVNEKKFWWLLPDNKVLYRLPKERPCTPSNQPTKEGKGDIDGAQVKPPEVKQFKEGSLVKYIAESAQVGSNPALVIGQLYKIRKIGKSIDGSDQIFLKGFDEEDIWWRKERFELITVKKDVPVALETPTKQEDKCQIGDHVSLLIDGVYNTGGTVVGFQDQVPLIWLDLPKPGKYGGTVDYYSNKDVICANIKKLGYDTSLHRCWIAHHWHTRILNIKHLYWLDANGMPLKFDDANSTLKNAVAPQPQANEVVDVDKAKSFSISGDVYGPYPVPTTNWWPLGNQSNIEQKPLFSPQDIERAIKTLEQAFAMGLAKSDQKDALNVLDQVAKRLEQKEDIVNTITKTYTFSQDNTSNWMPFVINAGANSKPLNFKFDGKSWNIVSDAPINVSGGKLDPEENFKVFVEEEEQPNSDDEAKKRPFSAMVKEDVIDAGYRVVANQLTKGIKNVFLLVLKDKGADDKKITLVRELLDSEIGNAFVSIILGYCLTYMPKVKEDKRAQKLAGEFRVEGLSTAGNALMNVVWQYVKDLPASEKIRVETKEVRVSEEEIQEIDEVGEASGNCANH